MTKGNRFLTGEDARPYIDHKGKGREERGLSIPLKDFSVQVELDFDADLDGDGLAIFHSGFELPLLHGFDGLLV